MQVEPGTIVDRYTFEGLLGTGGMAAVYLARHNSLGSHHAIKVLMLPSPAVQARLLQEGRAQSQISHPNIVPVTDVIDVGGSPGLVMEYVAGPTLRQLLRNEHLELDQVDRLARGILRGVAAAHRAGLVHRDLKPGNILLKPTDGTLVPKVTDFGLAKVLRPGGDLLRTRSGLPMGTPSYMAPEQIKDAANVDGRADIWALGAILFEMCSGMRAFKGADVVETYRMISDGAFIPIRELVPNIPDRMARAIEGSLRVNEEQRFLEVSSLLETWRGGVDLSDAGTLDPALVVRASALVSSPEQAPIPSGRGWSGSGGSEATWADPDLANMLHTPAQTLHQPPLEPTVPVPARRRVPMWAWGLAALGAVSLAVPAVWWMQPEPADPTFTVSEIPVVLDDPVLQEELDEAWAAMLDLDFEESERRLSVVLETDPASPAPWLVANRLYHFSARYGESLEHLWTAVDRAEEVDGPGSELAFLVADLRSDGWSVRHDEALDYLDEHPDDYLAHLIVLSQVPPTERDTTDEVYERLREMDETVALTWWARSERLLVHEEFEEAEQALRKGLESNPRTPTLLASLGDVLLRRGRVEEARDALVQALEIAPGDALARTRLAGAWLMLGQDDDVRRVTEQMTRPPTRWDDQARYAMYVADVYWGLGRLNDAVALLRESGKAAGERSEWTTALLLYAQIPVMYMEAEMVLPMVDATGKLVELSHQPEIPDTERENLVRNLLYAEGIGHVRMGHIAEAEQVLARLETLDRVHPVFKEWLRREIAIARGQPDRVATLFDSISEGCMGDFEKASALSRAGGHPMVVELLDARLDAPETCQLVGPPLFLRAAAHVTRAEIAFSDGDEALAKAHLDAFAELWPSPDRDIPAVERARSLRIRMGL